MSTKPYIGGIFIFTLLIMFPLFTVDAAYNGECWVVSNGDTIYKLDSADALMDPNGITIPDVSQVQTVEVDPKTGVVWISVGAANTVFRYDTAVGDFKPVSGINRPNRTSVNPSDGTIWVGGIDSAYKIAADGTGILATITGLLEPDVSVNTKDGSCWITDKRGKIVRYDANGQPASTPFSLNEPTYVAVNPNTGNVWATDTQANILVKLDPSGKEIKRIEAYPMPMSPRVNSKDNSLWFISASNSLVKLDDNGTELVKVEGAGMAILCLSINPKDGTVWIADQFGSSFQGGVSKYSASGQKLVENPVMMPSYVSIGHWSGQ